MARTLVNSINFNEIQDKIKKNYIINGGLDFWQRGTSTTSVNDTSQFLSDRIRVYAAGNSAGTISRSVDVPDIGVEYSHFYDLSITDIDIDNRALRSIHRLESYMLKGLEGKRATFSFWIKTDHFSQVDVVANMYDLRDDASNSTNFFEQSVFISANSQWARHSVTMDIPSNVHDRGFEIQMFCVGSPGSSQTRITGYMLTEGDILIDFQRAGRDYAEELQLCQRYFLKTYSTEVPVGSIVTSGGLESISNNGGSGGAIRFNSDFPVEMRNIPTVTPYNPSTGAAGTGRNTSLNTDFSLFSTKSTRTVSFRGSTTADSAVTTHFTADAEL